jgi:hypothetical protein
VGAGGGVLLGGGDTTEVSRPTRLSPTSATVANCPPASSCADLETEGGGITIVPHWMAGV